MVHDAYTPSEVPVLFVRSGVAKIRANPFIIFGKACFSGMFLGFGGALSTLIGGGTHGIAEDNPGLVKLLSGACFPVGIIMTVLQGQELLTSNMMIVPMAVMCKQVRWYWILFNWTIVFFGNLVGTLFWDAILVKYSEIFTPAYAAYAIKFAVGKAVTPTWGQIFLRGIGCNLLVCLAVWQATAAREIISKIIALWIPVFIFVALGFDHVVANMYFIPIAIMWGAPEISTGFYIWKSLIPSLLGNIVGALLLAVPFRFFYMKELSVFTSPSSKDIDEEESLEGSALALSLPKIRTRKTKKDQEKAKRNSGEREAASATATPRYHGSRSRRDSLDAIEQEPTKEGSL